LKPRMRLIWATCSVVGEVLIRRHLAGMFQTEKDVCEASVETEAKDVPRRGW